MGRRHNSGTQISLFPFLSILAALIGALVVIIAGLAIIQLNKAEGREPEEVERARENRQIVAESEDIGKENDEMRSLMEMISRETNDLAALVERKTLLRQLQSNAERSDLFRDELRAQLAQLQQENKALEVDHTELLAKIEALLKEMAERQKVPEKAAVQIRPGGSSRNKRAYFVEVADATVILHSKEGEPARVPKASLRTSGEFRALLRKVDEQPYRTLTFLIRGNDASLATYNEASQIVDTYFRTEGQRKDFRAGKLPIPGEGTIDLSVFAEYME